MPTELPMKPDSGIEGGWRNNHPSPADNEALREYLYESAANDFLNNLKRKPMRIVGPAFVDRCAIGIAAAAGRTASEIDRFFGWEGQARYRLKELREMVKRKSG
jgi:hypothetical protein